MNSVFSVNETMAGDLVESRLQVKFDANGNQEVSTVLLGSFLVTIILVGFFSNIASLVIYLRCKDMRKPQNVLILNLALADLGMVLGSQVPTCISSFSRQWIFGQTACTVSAFLATNSGFASIGTMTLIAFDRYDRLSRPLQTLDQDTFGNKRSFRLIALVWAYSLFLSLPPLFYNGYGSPDVSVACILDYTNASLENRLALASMYTLGFVVPLSCIIYLYKGIFGIIRTSRLMFGDSRQDQRQMEKEFKVGIASVLCVLIFVIAWTPFAVLMVLGNIDPKYVLTSADNRVSYTSLTATFAKGSAACNGIIYGLCIPQEKYRRSSAQQAKKLLMSHAALYHHNSRRHQQNLIKPVEWV